MRRRKPFTLAAEALAVLCSRRHRALVVAIASLFVFAAVLYVLIGNPFDPFDDRSFDSEVWKSAAPEARARMSEDLVKHHLPTGMTESQVVTLLGEPGSTEEGQTEAPRHVGTHHLLYDLGGWSMHGMDAAYVYVHLDEKRNVVAAEVYGY
jgi:hypothetical protein